MAAMVRTPSVGLNRTSGRVSMLSSGWIRPRRDRVGPLADEVRC